MRVELGPGASGGTLLEMFAEVAGIVGEVAVGVQDCFALLPFAGVAEVTITSGNGGLSISMSMLSMSFRSMSKELRLVGDASLGSVCVGAVSPRMTTSCGEVDAADGDTAIAASGAAVCRSTLTVTIGSALALGRSDFLLAKGASGEDSGVKSNKGSRPSLRTVGVGAPPKMLGSGVPNMGPGTTGTALSGAVISLLEIFMLDNSFAVLSLSASPATAMSRLVPLPDDAALSLSFLRASAVSLRGIGSSSEESTSILRRFECLG